MLTATAVHVLLNILSRLQPKKMYIVIFRYASQGFSFIQAREHILPGALQTELSDSIIFDSYLEVCHKG